MGSAALNMRAVGEAELVRGRDVERALEVEARVGAEGDAGRVEKEKVGAGDGRADGAIDVGARAAGHPADDVADLIRSGERRPLADCEGEPLEAVEQVASGPGAEIGADLEVAAEPDPRPDRAISHDVGQRRRRETSSQEPDRPQAAHAVSPRTGKVAPGRRA